MYCSPKRKLTRCLSETLVIATINIIAYNESICRVDGVRVCNYGHLLDGVERREILISWLLSISATSKFEPVFGLFSHKRIDTNLYNSFGPQQDLVLVCFFVYCLDKFCNKWKLKLLINFD